MSKVITLIKRDRDNFINEFNSILDTEKDGYLLVLSDLDTYEKSFPEKLAERLDENPDAVLATPKHFFQLPDRMAGIMFRLPIEGLRLNERLKFEYEADFLLKLMAEGSFLAYQDIEYEQGEPGDGNYKEFFGIYEKQWYTESIDRFLIPLLRKCNDKTDSLSSISYLVKSYAMYHIACRLDANMNNNNRHVLDAEETEAFKAKISEALGLIDDDIIMNSRRMPVYKRDFQYSRMLLRIKYGVEKLSEEQGLSYVSKAPFDEDAKLDDIEIPEDYFHYIDFDRPALFMMKDGVPIHSTLRLRCNIQLIEYKNGRLEIDGSMPDIYDKEKFSYYFEKILDSRQGEPKVERFKPVFCERYSLTKFFGESAYKRYPFHVSIPVKSERALLKLVLEYEGESYFIPFEFQSHTSKLALYPRRNYCHMGDLLLTVHRSIFAPEHTPATGIRINPYSFGKMAYFEFMTGLSLLNSFQMHRFRFLMLRMAWVVTRPYFKRKKIWLFFDKIYKGGDSAEYLYKYSEKQNDGIKKYYLIDKNVPDYKRLVSEGYKPLKRGSFLHRLVFLNADTVLVTNSTVFAFNDYYLENSRYIRGIPDFRVVCLQHGLSVQKIAIAQQRLRDNTKLYFLASKVEMENLMHPVYDYAGYDALKLTGIPRYDGLVNDDKKQILISPTWRMQSAMFVTKNEGVERDYNPEFKHTEYFKLYNGLINNEKLIKAAEEYGYRLVYVLHPIVSPQAEDFDKNDYVDIVPSTGDMSYEKLFCESSLMVTDYSGVQFDYAYMRKPIVYYHPEELEAHYEEGTFHYDTMAFGEIVRRRTELIELLTDYMKNGCEMKELYRMRADEFFCYDDRENCKRAYEELMKDE